MMDASDTDPLSCTLIEGAGALGIALTEPQLDRLLVFLHLLQRWNHAYNLTAIRDPAMMVSHHLLDSLAVAPYLEGETVLDLGTGAGLPGVPLAIMNPTRRFWLLDSNGKKVRFVRQVVLETGLGNVEPVQSRIESYRPDIKFSTIVARAVASIAQIHDQTVSLLARRGVTLLMKGRYPEEELADPTLAGLDVMVRRLRVPFLDGERHLIEIRHE